MQALEADLAAVKTRRDELEHDKARAEQEAQRQRQRANMTSAKLQLMVDMWAFSLLDAEKLAAQPDVENRLRDSVGRIRGSIPSFHSLSLSAIQP